jgi:dipeptidyl aminopeptidase/acylaminoacyl peptidase
MKFIYQLVLQLFITGSLFAQFSISSALSVPFPTDLKSSADGKTIAWVFNNQGERNIFVAEAPNYTARKITNYKGDEGIEINSLSFSPDGNRIVFVRGNGNNSKGEPANPAQLQILTYRNLYIINKDGTDLKKIGPGSYPKISPDGKTLAFLNFGQVWTVSFSDSAFNPQKLFQARGNQSQIRWSPDGSKLVFTSNRGDHSFIGLYSFSNKAIEFINPSIDLDDSPAWSPDGNQLVFRRNPFVGNNLPFVPQREGYPWSIRLHDLKTNTTREVWKADEGKGSVSTDNIPVVDNQLIWAVGNQLIFPWEKTGWQQLYALDMATGKTRLLTAGEGEVENVTISKSLQTIYYTCNIGDIDRRHIWQVDVKTGLASQISKTKNSEWSPVQTENGLAVLYATAQKPAWPALLSNNGTIADLAKDMFPAAYPQSSMVIPQAIMITATDGMKVPAQIFLPPNHKPGDKHPALIFIHGGSRRQMLLTYNYGQYYSNAFALNQYFANKGYVVISLNFRSGIGYGLEFREALNYGATGASEYFDLAGAGLYLKNRDDVDGKKIALWGGSYGGYLTAHGLARASDMFAVGVDIHGVHDWNEGIRNFVGSYNPEKLRVFAELAFQSSPENYIDGWKSPVLFIHGDDDRNVNFTETVRLAEMLRKRNVYFEQLVFPDEVHGFLLHRNWVKAYEASYEFINRQFSKK